VAEESMRDHIATQAFGTLSDFDEKVIERNGRHRIPEDIGP
jgi:hypothetical protein